MFEEIYVDSWSAQRPVAYHQVLEGSRLRETYFSVTQVPGPDIQASWKMCL